MTDYIRMLRNRFIIKREQASYRQQPMECRALAEEFHKAGLSDTQRAVRRLEFVLRSEKPIVFRDEKIALLRTVPVLPELFTEDEEKQHRERFAIHELGKVCNVTPDYGKLLHSGFDAVRKELQAAGADVKEKEQLQAFEQTLDAVQSFAEAYRVQAIAVGNRTVAESFSQIPAQPPRSFLQALQMLRLLHYCLWASYNYHMTLGRFDQYMLPYYLADRQKGMTQQEALELIEEFFICCNKDSDLYPGMQQGDNGQSMVLGGLRPDGSESFNDLSELCLQACEELRLIDPKINLRVNHHTPLRVYERGTKLTKLGLGFPQYSNDDVVIPALLRWGYQPQDAYEYTVAACWEFIIPGKGMDIPNIGGLPFPQVVSTALERLPACQDFEQLLRLVKQKLYKSVQTLTEGIGEIYMEPAPLLSLLMDGCLQAGTDISKGGIYNNFGIHGVGLATAVDSLAAVRKYVFDDKALQAQELLDMLHSQFKGQEEWQNILRYEAPKMGDDDDTVDALATWLLDGFASALEGKTNSRGGIYRGGTGSAMYYSWFANTLGATPDGRFAAEALPCNYSPSLFARCKGPLGVIKSFSKPHLERVANGGPLTIELHDSVFRDPDSITKVASFVKAFMDMGGHQMQINAVNRDTLLDAKKNPQAHKNLIVRVWGWSGYFVELDEVYQDHIIKRTEMKF